MEEFKGNGWKLILIEDSKTSTEAGGMNFMEGSKRNGINDLHRYLITIVISMEGFKGNGLNDDIHRRLEDLHGGAISIEG